MTAITTAGLRPQFHPQEDLLLGHATCREHPAVGLLLSTHAALCEQCRETFVELDAVGSLLLERNVDMPMSATSRQRALAAARVARRVAAAEPAGPEPSASAATGDCATVAATVESVLAIRDNPKGRTWHWRAPGVREVRLPLQWNGVPVIVAQLRSGLHIPQHTHDGRELTLVLSGSLRDSRATYRAGDIADYDSTVSHEQFVDSTQDCLCLVVNESRLVHQTVLGRAFEWISGA